MKPLCIDLYCGLGGWSEGALAEGYEVVGFDIERHVYSVPEMPEGDGSKQTKPVEKRGWTQGCAVSLGLEGANAKPRTRLMRYSAQLVLQDVTTLHGSQFKDAALIVASPPCKAYSYMAMPWKRAKVEAEWQLYSRDSDSPFADRFGLNDLFDACFRIQREASAAAGRLIPMVVENVKGAQRWVGAARWHFGSYYLWGDVPALMPFTRALKGRSNFHNEKTGLPSPPFNGAAHEARVRRYQAIKNNGGSWFAQAHNIESGHSNNPVSIPAAQRAGDDGVKQGGSGAEWFDKALDERRKAAGGTKAGGDWFGTYAEEKAAGTISPGRLHGKDTDSRKAASAQIAKIPFDLAAHVARCLYPDNSVTLS